MARRAEEENVTSNWALALGQAEQAAALAESESPCMDEQEFRAFYAGTARSLRSYILSSCRDTALADDLLQDTYFKFLRAKPPGMEEAHRKNYLFRIATNLIRDHFRRSKHRFEELAEVAVDDFASEKTQIRSDLGDALGELKPRQRELLWLAYVEGSKHTEIADALGLKSQSIRPMLFRARQKLLSLLESRGIGPAARRRRA